MTCVACRVRSGRLNHHCQSRRRSTRLVGGPGRRSSPAACARARETDASLCRTAAEQPRGRGSGADHTTSRETDATLCLTAAENSRMEEEAARNLRSVLAENTRVSRASEEACITAAKRPCVTCVRGSLCHRRGTPMCHVCQRKRRLARRSARSSVARRRHAEARPPLPRPHRAVLRTHDPRRTRARDQRAVTAARRLARTPTRSDKPAE